MKKGGKRMSHKQSREPAEGRPDARTASRRVPERNAVMSGEPLSGRSFLTAVAGGAGLALLASACSGSSHSTAPNMPATVPASAAAAAQRANAALEERVTSHLFRGAVLVAKPGR